MKFELKHSEDFNRSQISYFEPSYEVDTENNEFGDMGRIWDGSKLIGSFYFSEWRTQWVTTPYYLGTKYVKNNESYLRYFANSDLAVNYIKRLYEQR